MIHLNPQFVTILPKRLAAGVFVWLFFIFRIPRTPVPAYWFSQENYLQHGDDRLAEIGVTHKHEGRVRLCHSGFHASLNVCDAIPYAPGSTLWKVELNGRFDFGAHKLAASERKYLKRIDMVPVRRRFFQMVALDSLTLFDCEIPRQVKRFLITGNARYVGSVKRFTETMGGRLDYRQRDYLALAMSTRWGDGSKECLQGVFYLFNPGLPSKDYRSIFASMVEDAFNKEKS